MSEKAIPYRVVPMTINDLDRVMEIEEVAHITPWTISGYRHELEKNDLAYYYLLIAKEPIKKAPVGLRERLLAQFCRPHATPPIIGYGGFWIIADETHISTIAIDPEWQGLGLGELLMLELIENALRRNVELITLEVRASNKVAQNLYKKYGFKRVGRRKNYYKSDNEDGYIMTVENVQSQDYRDFLDEQWLRLSQRLTQQ